VARIIILLKPQALEHIMRQLNVLIIVSLLVLFSCSENRSSITDELRPVYLTRGQTDTLLISDLFYASSYGINIKQSPHIEVQYLPQQNLVILNPQKTFTGVTYFRFEHEGRDYYIPVEVRTRQQHRFTLASPHSDDQVRVIGSFNDWNRSDALLVYNSDKKRFEGTRSLEPGRYEYRFQVNGREIIDPANKHKIRNPFGEYNSVLTVEAPHIKYGLYYHDYAIKRDTAFVRFRITQPVNVPRTPRAVYAVYNNTLLEDKNIDIRDNILTVRLDKKAFPKRSALWAAVQFVDGGTGYKKVTFQGARLAGHTKNRFNWHDAIVYSLFVDRFADGNPANNSKVKQPGVSDKVNFMGGDLSGLLQKINEGYFDELGVNVLWLSPVIQNPKEAWKEYRPPQRLVTGYHGYWPVLPRKVDDRFGTMDDLKAVTEAAHQHGMRVILDFVSNHVHKNHPYFIEHPDWFGSLKLPDGSLNLRQWDSHRLTTWFEPFLPSFDYSNNEALEKVTDDALWWLETSGADGFRQDAVKHVPNAFWRRLTQKIKHRVNPQRDVPVFQIGETFGSYSLINSYVSNGQLNAQFNFPLYDTALPVFTRPEGDFNDLNREILKGVRYFGMDHLMGNLMDSHDKARFMAWADGDIPDGADVEALGWSKPPRVDKPESYSIARLYMLYMLTVPGIPVIYYGDEIGMTGAGDPDNRRMMRFGNRLSREEAEHKKEIGKLIRLRRTYPTLRYGDYRPVYVDKDVLAYIRSDLKEQLLVVLNKSKRAVNLDISFPEDVVINSVVPLHNARQYALVPPVLKIALPARQGQVFLLK